MSKLAVVLSIILLLVGCASTPNVTYSYYPARSQTTLTITQTIACTADQQTVVSVYSADATTIYTADTTSKPYELPIKSLDGRFSDADIKATFTEDGRLQTINRTATGQGENLIKAAVTLGTAAAGLAGGGENKQKIAPTTACKAIKARGGDKPVTLTYTKVVSLETYTANKFEPLSQFSNDPGLYSLLKEQIPQVGVNVNAPKESSSGATYPDGQHDDAVMLTLQKTANVKLEFQQGGNSIATCWVTVPISGTRLLPIPKAAWFGNQTFALTLAGSGAISSIEYSKTAGGADAAGALSSILTGSTPSSASDKAAEIKGKADLIAQQQRLARCQADPANCQ